MALIGPLRAYFGHKKLEDGRFREDSMLAPAEKLAVSQTCWRVSWILGPRTWTEAQSFLWGLKYRSSRAETRASILLGAPSGMAEEVCSGQMGLRRTSLGQLRLREGICPNTKGSMGVSEGQDGMAGLHEGTGGRHRITIVATSFRSQRLLMLAD